MAKNIIKFFLLTVITLSVFTGCNKDSDSEPDDVITKSQLIGNWEATEVQVGGVWKDVSSDPSLAMSMTFYDRYNGKSDIFYGFGQSWECWGSYAISGENVSVIYDGAVYMTIKVKNFNGSDKAQVAVTRGNITTNAVIVKTGNTPITPDV